MMDHAGGAKKIINYTTPGPAPTPTGPPRANIFFGRGCDIENFLQLKYPPLNPEGPELKGGAESCMGGAEVAGVSRQMFYGYSFPVPLAWWGSDGKITCPQNFGGGIKSILVNKEVESQEDSIAYVG